MIGLQTVKHTMIIGALLMLILAGCASQDSDTTSVETPESAQSFSNIAFATGKVVPSRWATLSMEAGGRLIKLVEEGSEVTAGDVLAQLDAAELEQAVAQAEASLASAEAQLAKALAGATDEEIAAAEGAVDTALGNVAVAEATLAKMESSTGLTVDSAEAGLAQAKGTLEVTEAELARAQAELSRVRAGVRPEEVAVYQARLAQAEAELRIPTNAYNDLINKDVGGVPEEQARFRVQAAQGARDAAQAQLALAQAGPTASEIAAAGAAVRAAQAQVTISEAGVAAAEAALAKAQAGLSDVAVAEAQLQIAEGQLAQASADSDKLIAGATDEDIAIFESQVDQAKAALAQTKAALAKATLIAPFAGTVGTVYPRSGELIMAGTPVLVLGDVNDLRVETNDLNEVDAAQVEVGSPVTLTFDVLPGKAIEGTILSLSPMASIGQGGGTNFRALITMEESPETLRWGMTAGVDVELD